MPRAGQARFVPSVSGLLFVSDAWTSFGEHFVFKFPERGCIGGLGLGSFGAILGWFLAAGGAVLCAKRTDINTAFVSQSIAPKTLHETMFREHVSGN
jgi:hypothetical protein